LRTSLRRLRKGGRIVVNMVTLESLEDARKGLAAAGFSPEVVALQIARGRELAGRTLLEAGNTVFIVSSGRAGGGPG
ncbi:MAG: cobalamin biosynthesis protein CbiE, partial [Deltaproteobacteria bacterium]|nr:cobalamin biosynthesis protein CbiE [Deltaproteobacteria bacterium]